jgi:hypothetical protein
MTIIIIKHHSYHNHDLYCHVMLPIIPYLHLIIFDLIS